MSNLSYPLKKISEKKVLLNNRFFQQSRALTFQLNEDTYDLQFLMRDGKEKADITVCLQMDDGVMFDCNIDARFMTSILADLPHMEDYEAMPDIIRNIALEVSLEKVLDGIDHFCGSQSTIIRTIFQSVGRDQGGEFFLGAAFILKRKGDEFLTQGYFETDAVGMDWILNQLNRLSPKNENKGDLIPLVGDMTMGHSVLSIDEIMSLELYDILLLENPSLQKDIQITIYFSSFFAIEGVNIESNELLIQNILSDTTQNLQLMEKQIMDGGNSEVTIDDIPVKLVFEIGDIHISVGELRQIQPGYTLQLNHPVNLDKPIAIKANGICIGKGEILQIENRIGIRVLELSGINGNIVSPKLMMNESDSKLVNSDTTNQ